PRLKEPLGPAVAKTVAVAHRQILVEMLGREPLVAVAVQPLDLLAIGPRHRPPRSPPQPTIRKTIIPRLLEPANPAAKRPLVHAQKLGRLKLTQLVSLPPP